MLIRKKRSSRNVPSSIMSVNGRLVAQMMRTSTWNASFSPTRRTSPDSKKSQQFHLHRLVQFAEFVEEQRAAVGDFQQSLAADIGTGERTFAMSEELAFDELFRQSTAIDSRQTASTARGLRS